MTDQKGPTQDELQRLISMGFEKSVAQNVLGRNRSLEGAIDELLGGVFDTKGVDDDDIGDENDTYDCHFDNADFPGTSSAASAPQMVEDENFAHPIKEGSIETYIAIAKSIIDSQRCGTICPEEDILLSWANKILNLHQSIRSEGEHLGNIVDTAYEELFQLCQEYDTFNKNTRECLGQRKQIENENMARMADNEQSRRQRERSRIYRISYSKLEGEEANNNLKEMIERRDELRTETRQQRDIVLSYMNTPFCLKEQTLGEIYIFLKEFVHNNIDLDSDENRELIHKFVFSRIDSSHSSVVPCLLELMLLENEDVLLLRGINNILNTSDEKYESILQTEYIVEEGGCAEICHKEEAISQAAHLDTSEQVSKLQEQHRAEFEYLQKVLDDESSRQKHILEKKLKARHDAQRREQKDYCTLDKFGETFDDLGEKEQLNASLKDRNEAIKAGLKKRHIMIIDAVQNTNQESITDHQIDEIKRSVMTRLKEVYSHEIETLQQTKREENALGERVRKKLNDEGKKDDHFECYAERDAYIHFIANTHQTDSTIASNTQQEMERPIGWLSGCMVGSMYELPTKQENIDRDTSQSALCMRNAIDVGEDIATLYSDNKNNLMRLQCTLYKEKTRQEECLQDRLLSLREKRLSEAEEEGCSVRTAEQEIQALEDGLFCHIRENFKCIERKLKMNVLDTCEASAIKYTNYGESDPSIIEYELNSMKVDDKQASASSGVLDRKEKEKEKERFNMRDRIQMRKKETIVELQRGGLSVGEAEQRSRAEEKWCNQLFEEKWQLKDVITKRCEKTYHNMASRIVSNRIDCKKRGQTTTTKSLEKAEKTGHQQQTAKEKWHKAYSAVTRDLIKTLRDKRKKRMEELKSKWAKKEEELNSALGKKEITECEKQTAKNKFNSARTKDFANQHKVLTFEEYDLIEGHKKKVFRDSREEINVHVLLDDIHEEFEKERRALRQEMHFEQMRQSRVLEQKKQKRRESRKIQGPCRKQENNEGLVSKQKDLDAELEKISDRHNKEREKFVLTMDVEQARQRQVLQKRLASKRRSRRMSEPIRMTVDNDLPPIIRKQGAGNH